MAYFDDDIRDIALMKIDELFCFVCCLQKIPTRVDFDTACMASWEQFDRIIAYLHIKSNEITSMHILPQTNLYSLSYCVCLYLENVC
jgi:hypothetical protein